MREGVIKKGGKESQTMKGAIAAPDIIVGMVVKMSYAL